MTRGGFPTGGSEYGGYAGRIQPDPHPFGDGEGDAAEQLQAAFATDPADESSTPERVVEEWRRQGKEDTRKQNG